MTVTKKVLQKNEVELTIEIPYDEIQKELQDAATKISQEHKIPGFRPGKVPMDVLKKQMGEQHILETALEQIVQRTFVQAIIDEKLETVGQPKINVVKAAPGNPVIYTATVALLPNVELADHKTFSVEQKAVSVADADIEKTIDDVRKARATETLVARPAQTGDKAEVDFSISVDKVPIDGGESKNHPVMIGEKHFIPGFEEGLIGMKAGEEKTYPVTFPENYHAKHLAGKPAEAKVKVQSIFEVKLPEVDDAFAKGLGAFNSMDEVRKKIHENMLEERKQREIQRYEVALVDDVIKRSTFGDIPEILIEREAEKMLSELEHNTTGQGMDFENYLTSIKRTRDELKKEFRDDATKRVKAALILRAISKAEKVTVELEELEAEKNRYLAQYPNEPKIREQMQSPAFDEYCTNIIGNRKVFAILKSYADKTVQKEPEAAKTDAEKNTA